LKKASPSHGPLPPTSKTFRKRDFATEKLCCFQLTYICISPFLKVFERMGARGKENFFKKVFLPPKKPLATALKNHLQQPEKSTCNSLKKALATA